MLTFFSRAVTALTMVVLCSTAAANAAPAVLAPPRAITSTAAPYPNGAHGDAIVLLDVVVARDGTIASAKVADGVEPFASAARAAAPSWKFEPATRDGAPINARVRVQVSFHDPAPVQAAPTPSATAPAPSTSATAPAPSVPPAPSSPSSSSSSSPPPSPPIDTIHVHMPPPPIGRTVLRAEEIRELPGAFGEPARALESLPGVSPYASGLPFVSVRGAMPSATAYTLDGMRLPAFFHYGLGVSTFHPALLESFDFFSGAAPAWAGRAFNVVAGESRAPAVYPHAEGTVRAFDSSALVETPFADGRGSLLVAGRYGYPGPIVQAVNSDVRLQYANYQARATWSFEHAGTVTALFLGMRDLYASHEGGYAGDLNTVDTWSHRLDLRYDVDVAREGHLRVGVTLGDDENAAYFASVRSVQGRAQIDVPITTAVHARAGIDVYASWLHFDFSGADPSRIANFLVDAFFIGSYDAHRSSIGAWTDFTLRLAKGVEIVPGVRVDGFDGDYYSGGHTANDSPTHSTYVIEQTKLRPTAPAVSPRIAARAMIVPGLTFVASGGMATMEPVAAFPLPGNDYLTYVSARAPQSATMLDMGFQARLPGDIGVRAVAFQNSYRNMTLFPICVGQDQNGSSVCHADGTARGIETVVRRDLGKRLGGWISYTLTFTKLHAPGQPDFADPLERRHQLSAVASYDLGGGFRVGGRFVFYTGAPFATTSTYSGGKVENASIDPYPQRPSAFWRIDARIEKRWMLSSRASVAVALEWLNATLNEEAQTVCSIRDNGPRTCMQTARPLLTAPSLSFSGEI